MSPQFYSFLHVASAFLLVGLTFSAFAAPTPARRRTLMMSTGIAALVMLIAGFGLLAKLKYGWPGWVIGKMVCWLVLAGMVGMAYRMPGKTGTLAGVTAAVVVAAAFLVYYKPF